jgi:hypothetical protein
MIALPLFGTGVPSELFLQRHGVTKHSGGGRYSTRSLSPRPTPATPCASTIGQDVHISYFTRCPRHSRIEDKVMSN